MPQDIRTFTDKSGQQLIISSNKSSVVFGTSHNAEEVFTFKFKFDPIEFMELLVYLEEVANKAWSNLEPRVADSDSSDYYSYYDRPLDSEGYLSIGDNTLTIERPALTSNRLYKFNKRRMESFIHDIKAKYLQGYFCVGMDLAGEGTKSKTIINGKEVD
ncbi:hypothetical protein F400_gp013 [Bacillus phage BCD7]|uniref:Uncharacterized protein n=1 Tax=Bacillus phage BCD7 TaxID=1136534 RepID=J9PV82_9CAUD|nr:hypothetical protein F400_gp013 [Bacillus phage BCD7]AEZ50460.1 hypothetical protein BCD7_0013 [Bacillus phage BCD7]